MGWFRDFGGRNEGDRGHERGPRPRGEESPECPSWEELWRERMGQVYPGPEAEFWFVKAMAHRNAWFHGGRGAEFGGPRGGMGGRGGRGFSPFGFGGDGPGGGGFRAGRKLSSADLQLVFLALLGEKPRHGYDLIKAIEERSNGFYVPSPGVVYPALTYLEEAGEAKSEAEGSRKLFQLTDAGRARLEKERAQADAILAQLAELGRGMDRVREAFSGGFDGSEFDSLRDVWATAPELIDAIRQLRTALAEQRGASREHWLKIVAALLRAADEIREATDPKKK